MDGLKDKLKGCPFCGYEADYFINTNRTTHTDFVFIKCKLCGGQGRSYRISDSEYEENEDAFLKALRNAVEAWNMRAG